jgi:hypothetical protein
MALTPYMVAEEAAKFAAPIVFGPLAWLDFNRVGLSKETRDAIASPKPTGSTGPGNAWQPLPKEESHIILWVLAAAAATGIVIAVLRK